MRLLLLASLGTLGTCAIVAVLAPLAGCISASSPEVGGPIDDAGVVGSPCVLTTDCLAAELCAYAIDAGCAATGVCVAEDFACMNDGPIVCACDGTPVGLACIYSPGYAAAPIPNTKPGCDPYDGGLVGGD